MATITEEPIEPSAPGAGRGGLQPDGDPGAVVSQANRDGRAAFDQLVGDRRRDHVWCAARPGAVDGPDGRMRPLEGGCTGQAGEPAEPGAAGVGSRTLPVVSGEPEVAAGVLHGDEDTRCRLQLARGLASGAKRGLVHGHGVVGRGDLAQAVQEDDASCADGHLGHDLGADTAGAELVRQQRRDARPVIGDDQRSVVEAGQGQAARRRDHGPDGVAAQDAVAPFSRLARRGKRLRRGDGPDLARLRRKGGGHDRPTG